MNLPARLEAALMKLYRAFNEQQLHPEDACRCAVGNILDGKDFWKHLSDDHGSIKLNYVGNFHESLGRRFQGYKPSELLQIEASFLNGCGYGLPLHHSGQKPNDPTDPELLFNGLVSVIATLSKLEGIDDLLLLKAPFETLLSEKRKKRTLAISIVSR